LGKNLKCRVASSKQANESESGSDTISIRPKRAEDETRKGKAKMKIEKIQKPHPGTIQPRKRQKRERNHDASRWEDLRAV
jgi:hypothetical protein